MPNAAKFKAAPPVPIVPHVTISRTNPDYFVIGVDDGPPIKVDPTDVFFRLNENRIEDAKDTAAVIEKFKAAIGMPQLPTTDALEVFDAFSRYMAELQKKRPSMRNLPAFTMPDPEPPPNSGQASGSDSPSTGPSSAPSESWTSGAPSSSRSDPILKI